MTIANESAIAHRRITGVVLLLLAVASLGAAAWGTWLQAPRPWDGTNAWTNRLLWPIANNQPPGGPGHAVAVSADGRVAMAEVGGLLYRTEDGGARWFLRPLPGGRRAAGGIHGRTVAISADGRRVLAVTRTWPPPGSNYAPPRSEIALSDDGGATWVVHDPGETLDLLHVALSADGMRGLATGNAREGNMRGRMVRTGDGGRTWTVTGIQLVPSEATGRLGGPVALAADGLQGIMPGLGDEVLRTTDGGATWTSYRLPARPAYRYDSVQGLALSADGGTGFAVTFQGVIWRSDDSGQTWRLVETAPQRHFARVGTSGDGRRVIARSSDKERVHGEMLHISADGGTTWTTMPLEHSAWDIALSADGQQGMMAESPPLRTSDGGLTWQRPDPPVRLMPHWPYGALGLAIAFVLALGVVASRRRIA